MTVVCQVCQVLLRDLEEVLTHLLMHEVLYPSRLPSSSTVPECTSLAASSGLCPWSRGLQHPCSKSLLCSQTTPWNKLLAVALGFPPVLTWVTIECTLPSACVSRALLWPSTLRGSPEASSDHRAARIPTPSQLTPAFQTPGCIKNTTIYCSHAPLSALKPKASKLISLAAPLCVSAWTPLHLPSPSLKQSTELQLRDLE